MGTRCCRALCPPAAASGSNRKPATKYLVPHAARTLRHHFPGLFLPAWSTSLRGYVALNLSAEKQSAARRSRAKPARALSHRHNKGPKHLDHPRWPEAGPRPRGQRLGLEGRCLARDPIDPTVQLDLGPLPTRLAFKQAAAPRGSGEAQRMQTPFPEHGHGFKTRWSDPPVARRPEGRRS